MFPRTLLHLYFSSTQHDLYQGHWHRNPEDLSHTPTVAAVSIKLPPFWPTDPIVWFVQVEAQFNTRGITAQKTRFKYVVASDFAVRIRDLLIQPPAETPYETLKNELIERTAASDQQKVASEQRKLQQLISGKQLGKRKPTQLLRRVQQLLGDHLGPSADNNTFQ